MISDITLKNFKKFKEETLDLRRPITLLYGENSSGKSSALKAIATLMQTFTWSRNQYESLLAQGEYVNLGTYREYVYGHKVTNKITISIGFVTPDWYPDITLRGKEVAKYVIELCYERSPYNEQARIYSVRGAYVLSDGETVEFFKLKKSETKPWYTLVTDPEALEIERRKYEHNASKITEREFKRAANLKTKVNYVEGIRFALLEKNSDKIAEYKLRLVQNNLYMLFELPERYKYLGPLRSSPSRSYTLSAASADVGPRGENTPSVVSYLKRSSESIKRNSEAFKKIQNWISLIFPGRSIAVQDYEELVKIKVVRDGVADSIQDVGFGFSQILPIIVQAAAIADGDTIIVEQPELHLHPRAQVAFSQFLIEACREGRRFIIETHSEHILRGLQLAISENSINDKTGITKEDLLVYYFPSEMDCRAFEIKINDDGELVDGWPPGFFDESYNLTKKIIRNKISKISEQKDESSN